jgi:hypothetical protein
MAQLLTSTQLLLTWSLTLLLLLLCRRHVPG